LSPSKIKKIYILEDISPISYFDNSNKLKIFSRQPKKDTFDKKYFISITNKFYIFPTKLDIGIKVKDIQQTISSDFNLENKIKNLKKNLVFNYQSKNKNNNKHISNILYSNISKSEDSEGVYFSIIEKKIILLFTQNKKLIFYNQFDLQNNNYIKYLILLYDEFNLDQYNDNLTYITSNIDENKIINELKSYFKNIIKYKKSIFNIIIEENE
tara:strand:- start:918 stop:1553 length:636 start_codon:yes stop_codon:yes gene_type:complete